MPFYKKINTSGVRIALWQLNDSLEELKNSCLLKKSDQEHFDCITSEKRKKEFLASRILIKKLVADNSEIIYNNLGKPFIKNSKKHISISHSANFVAVIVSDKRVGIDIEQSTRNIDRVATRFLHSRELEFIESMKNKQLAKILYWAAKEAIFKCSEFQGIQFNEQIIIAPFDFEQSNKFEGTLKSAAKNVNYRMHYFLVENNVMVYCVEQ